MPKIKKTEKVQTKLKKIKNVPIKRGGLTVDVFDIKGKVVETLSLPKEIFGSKVNDKLMSQAIRVYLTNQRRGTVSTKTRGQVRGSTRKIWRQKGTGRARHGAIRAPIFVHGGVAFGPKPRDFSLQFPKKMRRAALFSALSAKLSDKEIKIVKGLFKIEPKTKSMMMVLKSLSLNDKKKKILLVMPSLDESSKQELQTLTRAVRNIEGVSFLPANNLNTYVVLNNKMLLLMKESVPFLEKTFLKSN